MLLNWAFKHALGRGERPPDSPLQTVGDTMESFRLARASSTTLRVGEVHRLLRAREIGGV